MPSYMDPASGYVQWQSARRRAKQMAQDAVIDIIDNYNRAMIRDGTEERVAFSLNDGSDVLNSFRGEEEEESPRAGNKLTPRALAKKRGLGRHGGVFTEGISSLSRRSQYSLSLKRSDIVSENLPENVKVAREKSRIYLALATPNTSKGNISLKSGRSLPPPSSFHHSGEKLMMPEVTRSRTFTLDDRAALSTRSTLDSRQTVSDSGQAGKERRLTYRQGTNPFSLYYPTITGAPPNTPLNAPPSVRAKPPSVNIVSLGGESVETTMRRHDSRNRLPQPYRVTSQDLAPPRGKDHASTMTAFVSKASSKPGIDLPHLPLRYAEAKDASFQFTPRERPGRMNYNRGRRHPIGHLRQSNALKPGTFLLADYDAEQDSRSATNDPYADRFRQESSVMSVGDVYIPYAPPTSAASRETQLDADNDTLPEVMLTVHEEDGESGGEHAATQTANSLSLQPAHITGVSTAGEGRAGGTEESTQVLLSERFRHRSQSCVSNASLLSVPMAAKDFIEARPPVEEVEGEDGGGGVTLHVPLPAAATEEEQVAPVSLHIPLDEVHADAKQVNTGLAGNGQAADLPPDSPVIAPTSVVNTARTIATQTELPYDPQVPDLSRRPTVVKIRTLSMFPDISGGGVEGLGSVVPEPLLRMTHGDPLLDATAIALPHLRQRGLSRGKDSVMDDEDVFKDKSNAVQNITFMSPSKVQQNAKRF